jgi:parallel beta-helix repeat protein
LLLSFTPASSPIDVIGSPTNPIPSLTGTQQVSTHRTSAPADASGDFQLVWESQGILTGLFSSSGIPLGNPVQVSNIVGGTDSQATLGTDGAGNSVVAWTHTDSGSGLTSVELQYFGSGLVPNGSPISFSSVFSSGNASQPCVAMNGTNVVIAYTDTNSNGTVSEVDAVEITGGVQTPISVSTSSASQPSVAMNSSDAFVIAYTTGASGYNQIATGYVMAQQYTSIGAPSGSAIVVNSSSTIENEPAVGIDDNGNFVVAYTDIFSSTEVSLGGLGEYIDNGSNVNAVLYNSQEVVQDFDSVWESSGPTQNGYDPSVAMNGAGEYVVSFTTGGYYASDGSGSTSVIASAYTSTGALEQPDIQLAQNMPGVSSSDGDNSLASVALSASGTLEADWQNLGVEYVGENPAYGVFTQTFLGDAPFTVQLPANPISIVGGIPTTYQITISRSAGYTLPLSVSFAPLPAGVTATVSPDSTSSSDVRTVTFNSADGVTMDSYFASTLTVSDGTFGFNPNVNFSVTPSQITGTQSAVTGGPENVLILGESASISGSGFTDVTTVQFGLNGPTATPTSIATSGDLLYVVVPSSIDIPSTSTIYINRSGGDSIASNFTVTYSDGGITFLDINGETVPNGQSLPVFAAGYSMSTPTGTLLTVNGYNFQPGDMVLFGPQLTPPPDPTSLFYDGTNNQNLPGSSPLSSSPPNSADWLHTANVYGTTPTYIDPDGSYLEVDVPEDAVGGQVTIVQPLGYVLQSTQNVQVFSFRNSFGFSLENGKDQGLNGQNPSPDNWDAFDVTEQDLSQEFPGSLDALNYITSNIQLGIWSSKLSGDGSCFGMDVTASLLYQEYIDGMGIGNNVTDIPPANDNNFTSPYAPVFSLEWDSILTMNGTTLPLVQVIHLNLLSQMSVFTTNTFLAQEAEYAEHSGSSDASNFIGQITGELAAGRPPIIGITAAGHSILAYNVESDNAGGYYIDCYNPNDPVDSSPVGMQDLYQSATQQGSEPASAGEYLVQTQAGMFNEDNQDRIHIASNGDWNWTQDNGELYTGNLTGGGLQIYPVNINAVDAITPFIGPAGTMSLPSPGNDVLIDGAIIVLAETTPAAVGAGVTIGTIVLDIALSLLDASKPVPALASPATVADLAHYAGLHANTSPAAHSGKIWWVGSAAGSSFPDIQSAIDSPSVHSGATIYVEPGTYPDAPITGDTLNVNKSLTIIGGRSYPKANQHGPSIVTSDGTGFTLSASDISIEQFTIEPATVSLGGAGIATAADFQGSGYQLQSNVVEDEADGFELNTASGKLPGGSASRSTKIKGNAFANNADGIYSNTGLNSAEITTNSFAGDTNGSVVVTGSSQSSRLLILNNKITNDAAIVLQNATTSVIEGNQIVNPAAGNGDGIWLDGAVTHTQVLKNSLSGGIGSGNGIDSSGAGNSSDVISGNTVEDFGIGVRLNAAVKDAVSHNTIQQSSASGIDVANGCTGNVIISNRSDGNLIGVLLLNSDSNAIDHNTAEGNSNDGISVLGSNNNSIADNNASDNTGGAVGIVVYGNGNTISRNNASHNQYGIASMLSTNTTILGNTANDNQAAGIEVQDDVNASGQKDEVEKNSADGNADGGIMLVLSTYVTVSGNTASDDDTFGIELQNTSGADNHDIVSSNTADDNKSGAGISLIDADDNMGSRNTVNGNEQPGVASQGSNNNQLT